MSYKRKGQLTASPERHKHLRPYLRRVFWKGERRAQTKELAAQVHTLSLPRDSARPARGVVAEL